MRTTPVREEVFPLTKNPEGWLWGMGKETQPQVSPLGAPSRASAAWTGSREDDEPWDPVLALSRPPAIR